MSERLTVAVMIVVGVLAVIGCTIFVLSGGIQV